MFLILLNPYVLFIIYNDCVFEAANIVFIAGFFAASLLLSSLIWRARSALVRVLVYFLVLFLFIDFQFELVETLGPALIALKLALASALWVVRRYLGQIMSVAFATMLAATIAMSALDQFERSQAGGASNPPSARAGDPVLPVYVHLVLDEFLGIEGFDGGIPSQAAIKREIVGLLVENGFRVFGRAYSRHADTKQSLASLFNFVDADKSGATIVTSANGATLFRNRYFDDLIKNRYNINVYQSSYLDFCQHNIDVINKCLVYAHSSTTSDVLSPFVLTEKLKIILAASTDLMHLKAQVAAAYMVHAREIAAGLGVALPPLVAWRGRTGPIPVLPMFDRLIEDVATARRGDMFFAHLLIPHDPYALDADCALRRPAPAWNLRGSGWREETNSPESRLLNYQDYVEQVRCTMRKVGTLLAVLNANPAAKDAVVIIHGDHGSRICLLEAFTQFQDRFATTDFIDNYSTLYAAKSPTMTPGYDTRMLALPELLQATVFGEADGQTESATQPFVYMRDVSGAFFEVPMPPLPMPDSPTASR